MATVIEVTANNINLCKKELEQAVQNALEICGGKAEGYAIALAPVDTGSLKGSIRKEMEDNTTVAVKAGGGFYVKKDVVYAGYVELGTRKMKAQPYLKPAFMEHVQEYKSIIENELKKG